MFLKQLPKRSSLFGFGDRLNEPPLHYRQLFLHRLLLSLNLEMRLELFPHHRHRQQHQNKDCLRHLWLNDIHLFHQRLARKDHQEQHCQSH
jgi:hypothetical protein